MENQIFQDLKGLHLSGMADCWQNLQETRKHQEIVLQDGLVMLIQAEHDQRAANKTARLIKNARFRYDASIEQVLFDPAKGRDQGRIMQLASCEYIKQGASVLITGPAGVGKSYLSTALGYQACLSGYRGRYFNMSRSMSFRTKQCIFMRKVMLQPSPPHSTGPICAEGYALGSSSFCHPAGRHSKCKMEVADY